MQNVFVYGSLKRGFSNHVYLTEATFLGVARTRPLFALLNLGRYPGLVAGHSVILGEVFSVSPQIMRQLDALEANGRVYLRKLTTVDLADRTLQAWIYLYLKATGNEPIVAPTAGAAEWHEPI